MDIRLRKHAADKRQGMTLSEVQEFLIDAATPGIPADARPDAYVGWRAQIQRLEINARFVERLDAEEQDE